VGVVREGWSSHQCIGKHTARYHDDADQLAGTVAALVDIMDDSGFVSVVE
jgi:hypothetical protein